MKQIQMQIQKPGQTIRSILQEINAEQYANNVLFSVDNVVERNLDKPLKKGQSLFILPAVAGG